MDEQLVIEMVKAYRRLEEHRCRKELAFAGETAPWGTRYRNLCTELDTAEFVFNQALKDVVADVSEEEE